MNISKRKQEARYRETQEKVLEALAAAYEKTDYLYQVLKEITDEMWDELQPELQMILEKYLVDPHMEIDLSRYPAIRMALAEAERRQHWRLLEYFWIGYNVITDSLVETYQQSSADAYALMGLLPLWERETPTMQEVQLAALGLSPQQVAIESLPVKTGVASEVRITDTYITSSILPIPWCQDGKVYSQRLYGHVANFQSKLDFVLREGVSNGRGMEWMEKAWRQLVGATAYDTARLLKTETMAMYNRGLKDSYLEMGVEYVEIVGDAECGGICLDYVDGDPIPLEDADINVELPPYHPNCACSFVSYEETKIVEENEDEDEENLED